MIAYGAIKAAAPMLGHPTGDDLLRNPRPPQQRHRFHRGGAPPFRLEGLLPPAVATMALQVARRHAEIAALQDDLPATFSIRDWRACRGRMTWARWSAPARIVRSTRSEANG
jgi:malate dehydrogenase (oxaloacetate-decarboxylating)(NADP+)